MMKRRTQGTSAGRAWRIVGLATAIALAVGCAKQPIIKEAVPTGSKDQVIKAVNARAKAARSLVAALSVKLQIQTAKTNQVENCGGNLAVEYPDRLRIRGKHDLLDYPPFDVGSDGQTWFWHGHFQDYNEMNYGPTAYLEQKFEPNALLKPRDVVMALGIGPIVETAGNSELLFTRNPGHYLITEVVNNKDGRYVMKRIFIDPDLMAIIKMETYRPDGAIDMIADMTFDETAKDSSRGVPTGARIRLLRTDAFMLDLTLKDRKIGESMNPKLFAMPSLEGIKQVKQYGAGATSETSPKPIFSK